MYSLSSTMMRAMDGEQKNDENVFTKSVFLRKLAREVQKLLDCQLSQKSSQGQHNPLAEVMGQKIFATRCDIW